MVDITSLTWNAYLAMNVNAYFYFYTSSKFYH